jgi:hypothetical protein
MELMAAFRGGVISFDVASRMHGGNSLSTSPEISSRNLSLSTFARAVCLTYPIPRIFYECTLQRVMFRLMPFTDTVFLCYETGLMGAMGLEKKIGVGPRGDFIKGVSSTACFIALAWYPVVQDLTPEPYRCWRLLLSFQLIWTAQTSLQHCSGHTPIKL